MEAQTGPRPRSPSVLNSLCMSTAAAAGHTGEIALPDVQPQQEPVHGGGHLLRHITAVVLGVLIALGLVAGVEWIYHRHTASETRQSLRREIENNQKLIARDLHSIDVDRSEMQGNMVALRALLRNPNAKVQVTVTWNWESPTDSAWLAARDTRALALMKGSIAQLYAEIYARQQLVADESQAFRRTQSKVLVPMMVEGEFRDASPSQIEEALHNCAEVITHLQLLADSLKALDASYATALRNG